MAQFDDGKDQSALRTIGEVADALGIKQHVLRYWEQQFPMLQPLKRSGGRRYYRTEDVALVETIDRLVNREGYTIKGANKALAQPGMINDIEHDEPEGGGQAGSAPGPSNPLASDLPEDGGLEAFFGRMPNAEAQEASTPMFEPAEAMAQAADRAAFLADLKALRARLAGALAA